MVYYDADTPTQSPAPAGQSEPAQLTLVQYTIEGDPIFTLLDFDGETYRALTDNSRDKFAGTGAGLSTFAAKYLYEFRDGSGAAEVYLSDKETLTRAEAQSGAKNLFITAYAVPVP
jgi:hypothetical protein